ncbi:MAG: amidase [Sandaracinaceae bacterium]
MHPYLMKSAVELAALVREGETTSRELVDLSLERLRAVNPILNSVARARVREAKREADEADALLADVGPDRVGPLHGVPCTIKESFAVTGMPQSAGLVARKDLRAEHDATAVRRLRDAGAIVVGVTNIPELVMWMETSNNIYGRTRNPYDLGRIVGGSSGGEGASVGAAIAPFGLGADIGGSIRMPAFFNGVFGHKPSSGLVPNTGQWPIAENEALSYLCTGPLARRAEDLPLLLEIMAGPDDTCAACREMRLRDVRGVDVASLRVLDVPDNGLIGVHASLRQAQRRAADALRSRGARVEERRFGRLKKSLQYWGAGLSNAGGTPFGVLMGQGERVAFVPEMLKWALGRSAHTFPAIMLAGLELIPERFPSQTDAIVRELDELREELSDALGDDGVMLYPSYSRPAPRHHAPFTHPFDFMYTAIINVLGFPSTQVPLGLERRGLPVGVQVVAAHGNDHLTLAVARELERALGGWVPPPHRSRYGPKRTYIPGAP